MKKFLLNIGLFVVVLAVLAVIGDYMISSGLRKTTIRKYAVWNDIYNDNNLDNDLVLLGASSCWAHYNPVILDSILGISAYNLGIDGHCWTPCQPLRYNTYMRYAKQKPKYVLINIDMGTFGLMDYPQYEREQFFPYFWTDDSLISEIQEFKEVTFMERYCPLWRYIGYKSDIENGVASFFGLQHLYDDGIYKGHRGNDKDAWDRASLNIMDSIILEHESAEIESFVNFICSRKKEGCLVVLIKSPVYYELQERFVNREEISELLNSIARVTEVTLLDYWNHPAVQDSACFYNPSHLNKQGADLISTQLAHDIDSIINITEKK